MSERGSFTTEYIYCPDCFEVLKKHLLDKHKYLCSTVLPAINENSELPIIAGIIAGKIAHLSGGGEFHHMLDLLEEVSPLICHPVRTAVISENGTIGGFIVYPNGMVYMDTLNF